MNVIRNPARMEAHVSMESTCLLCGWLGQYVRQITCTWILRERFILALFLSWSFHYCKSRNVYHILHSNSLFELLRCYCSVMWHLGNCYSATCIFTNCKWKTKLFRWFKNFKCRVDGHSQVGQNFCSFKLAKKCVFYVEQKPVFEIQNGRQWNFSSCCHCCTSSAFFSAKFVVSFNEQRIVPHWFNPWTPTSWPFTMCQNGKASVYSLWRSVTWFVRRTECRSQRIHR